MLPYYQSYLNKLAQSPNDDYRGLQQAFNDSQWDNTTQLNNVFEQAEIGSPLYNPVAIQVDYATEMGTSIKKSDDYKLFNFKDLIHDVEYGLLYQYANLTWITVNKAEIGSIFQSITVRKCNNVAKWIDPDNGAIIEQPCVVEYDIGSSRPKQDKDIIVADNSMVLIIQGNEYTRKLKQNQRIIFNGRPWKLAGFNTSLQNDIGFGNNVTLYYYDFYLDMVQPSDDIQNNIANRYEYDYTVNIIQDNSEQVNGFTGKLNAEIKLNNNVVDRQVIWESNQFATITQDGVYTLTGVAGDVATIKMYMSGNPNIFDTVNIKIVDVVAVKYELVIEPLYTKINQNKTNIFNVTLFKNGVAQPDPITYVASGADPKSYAIIQDVNKFTLVGLAVSKIPLTLKFTSGTQTKSIDIQLKSAF
ncbi:MAG: hypothetical protein RSD67_02480 [Oscillospiraceae bacterium]